MSNEHLPDGIDRPDDDSAERALRQRFGAALADSATWTQPDAALGEAVLARIAAERTSAGARPDPDRSPDAEAARPHAAGPAALRPTPPVPRVRRTPQGRRLWLAAAAAAAVVAVGIGVLLARTGGVDDTPEQIAVEGTELAPGASAGVVVEDLAAGVAIRLEITDLEPAPEGSFYQGWVKNEAGDLVSVGTFHLRGGDDDVTLWSGVDLDDYPVLSVTLQREGEGTDSSGEVVLTGRLVD